MRTIHTKSSKKILLSMSILLILFGSAIMFGYSPSSDVVLDNEAKEIINENNVEQKQMESISSEKKDNEQKDIGQEDEMQNVMTNVYKVIDEEPGFYGTYSELDDKQYERTVLFFTTEWCPSCVEVDKDIENNRMQVPTKIAIIKIDFERNNELIKKYNVSKQHTFVLLDDENNEIKKWSNSKTLKDVIDNIN